MLPGNAEELEKVTQLPAHRRSAGQVLCKPVLRYAQALQLVLSALWLVDQKLLDTRLDARSFALDLFEQGSGMLAQLPDLSLERRDRILYLSIDLVESLGSVLAHPSPRLLPVKVLRLGVGIRLYHDLSPALAVS